MKMLEMQKNGCEIFKCITEIAERNHLTYTSIFGTVLGAIRHKGPIPWDYDTDIAVPVDDLPHFVDVLEKELPEKYWVVYRNDNEVHRPIARVGLRGYKTDVLHVDIFPIFGVPEDPEERKKLFQKMNRVVSLRSAKEYSYKGSSLKKRVKAAFVKYGLFFISQDALIRRYDKLCNRYPYATAAKVGVGVRMGNSKRAMEKSFLLDTVFVDYADFRIRVPREYDKLLTMIYGDYMKYPPEEQRNKALNKEYTLKKL